MSPASDLAAVAGAANVVADWSNINLSDFQNSDTESSLEQKKKALNWTRNAVQHAVNNEHLYVPSTVHILFSHLPLSELLAQ